MAADVISDVSLSTNDSEPVCIADTVTLSNAILPDIVVKLLLPLPIVTSISSSASPSSIINPGCNYPSCVTIDNVNLPPSVP